MLSAKALRWKADVEATVPERCPICTVEWTVMLGRKTARTIEWRCDACGWSETVLRPSAKEPADA